MRTALFDYDLPGTLIAQEPRPRGSSRLLHLDRQTGAVAHRLFSDLPEILLPGDLLVRNDVRVRPTRLYGRDAQDRIVEIFLLKATDPERRRWLALAKPGRRAKAGAPIRFDPDLAAAVLDVDEESRRIVEFDRPLTDVLLERLGHVPFLLTYAGRRARRTATRIVRDTRLSTPASRSPSRHRRRGSISLPRRSPRCASGASRSRT